MTEPIRKIAAIDVGSNSIHMLVIAFDGKTWKVLAKAKDQTRLGEALGADNTLSEEAFNRVIPVLKKMKDLAAEHDAPIRAVGTFAMREARNGQDFAARLAKRTGVSIEIIPGHEEARLVYLGVSHGLPIQSQSTLIVDIGGGSTEIVVGHWGEELFATSLKFGAVRLTQAYLCSDPFTDRQLLELSRYVETRLESVLDDVKRIGFERAVGSSGTIKAIQNVSWAMKGMPDGAEIHGSVLTADDIRRVTEEVCKRRSLKERMQIPGLDAKRADIIVAGAIVLNTITQLAGITQWTLSLSAVREGVILDTFHRQDKWIPGDPSDVRNRALKNFAKKFRVDEGHAHHIGTLAQKLFEQTQEHHRLEPVWLRLLLGAALLHETGKFLGQTGYHKHGAYFLKNSDIAGFSQRELDLLSLTIRYHRRRLPQSNDETWKELDKDLQKGVNICASLLRLAASLDRGRQGKITDLKVGFLGSGKWRLQVFHRAQDVSLELYQAEAEKEHMEKAFGLSQLELEYIVPQGKKDP